MGNTVICNTVVFGGDTVFFRPWCEKNTYNQLAEKIRNELFATFRRNGINVEKIHIDLRSNEMNVKVCMGRGRNLA